MTIDEICAAANRGEPVPENLLLHDAELYVCLRDTYSRYHSGQLKREDAEVEKKRLLYQHDLHKRQHAGMMRDIRRYQSILNAVNKYQHTLRYQLWNKAAPEEIVETARHISNVLDGFERVKDGRTE
jgi:hypothetical protein